MPRKNEKKAKAAARGLSEHAQGFLFGAIAGVAVTLLSLWAVMEPLIR